ncbi:bestrophin-3 isoform 1 [Anopheles sinensis]|uniref:Bestrophin-3 isoform 1 n=1 Tax=Anopheles sinensis TaxID=74873 RepID=A0A084VIU2_ANOSI|nr:bestrophin-3 isoform 1 [Anopheles sinensis]
MSSYEEGEKPKTEKEQSPVGQSPPGADSASGGRKSPEFQIIRFRQPKKRETMKRWSIPGERPVTPKTSQAQMESQIRMLELMKESKAKAFFERQLAIQHRKKE